MTPPEARPGKLPYDTGTRLVSSRLFAVLLLVGALARALVLPLGGTHDTVPWRIWAYNAANEGVSRLYGVGGTPPEWRTLTYLNAEGQATYPPLALHELGLAGRVFKWANSGDFPNTTALMVAVKMPALAADVGMALLAYLVVRRRVGESAARWACCACWLNPAVVLDGAALGYLDPQFVLPIVASLIAAASGRGALAGVLAAAAVLTKPQPAVIGPAVALALWHSTTDMAVRLRRFGAALAGGLACAALLVGPIIAVGAWPNFLHAMQRIEAQDMLSGYGANIWWIVGWAVRVVYSAPDMGWWPAIVAPAKILGSSRFIEIGGPDPRPIALISLLLVGGWAVWTTRRATDLWTQAALGAFLVHAFGVLGVPVHENHMFAAVPLLALAAAGQPAYRAPFFVVSAIVALNLNLFYGISEDTGWAIPRTLTVIDASLVLAAINCAALVWHLRRIRTVARHTSQVG